MTYNPLFYPFFSPLNEKPPTLYAILNSIANFGKEDKTKIRDLASASREKIFNFTYPLSTKVDKEEFEKMILNHYMMRRIGFETVTAFQIQLNVKLNSIMPMYNKLFDMLDGWDLLNDGEKVTRTVTDEKTSDTTNTNTTNNTSNNNTSNTTTNTNTSNNTTQNSLENTSTTNNTTINDKRESNLPQSEIENVQDGSYMTKYNLDKTTVEGSDNSTSNGNSSSETTDTSNTENTINSETTDTSKSNGTTNSQENGKTLEEISRTPADKISIYKQFQENLTSIYQMIFKELDDLFYGLI